MGWGHYNIRLNVVWCWRQLELGGRDIQGKLGVTVSRTTSNVWHDLRGCTTQKIWRIKIKRHLANPSLPGKYGCKNDVCECMCGWGVLSWYRFSVQSEYEWVRSNISINTLVISETMGLPSQETTKPEQPRGNARNAKVPKHNQTVPR